MSQQLVERTLPGTTRRVTLNIAESPLSWLRARRLVTDRQFRAGEQVRADYERAQLTALVTMNWNPTPVANRRSAPSAPDRTGAQLDAKRRFDGAIAAAGPGLADMLWRTVCACEPIPDAERALGWPARSGKLVLTLALDRVADHYRIA